MTNRSLFRTSDLQTTGVMLIKAGDLFRHYRIIDRVGEGGMGVVYRARDTKLDRDVALKLMVNATRVNSEHADRLRREARALAALNHPNILTIHDIGEADGLPFLVLEWVGGGALSDTSLQRPLSTREFLRIVLPVAEALGAAHSQVLGHFTHLEMEWEWPDLRRFWEQLAERFTVVRYDGRGMGLSDPYTGDFTEKTRQLDLEAVLTAVGAVEAVLLGISEGGWTAATYAIQHPRRITHLILYGAYSRGAHARPGYDPEEDQALLTLIRKGWGRDTPAFRQVFTSQFFRSDADPGLIAHFNELQRVSATPETAARYYESCHRRGDGRDLFRQVRIPTLVIHSRDDLAVTADEGRLLASIIPGAQLVLLPSGTHYFPTDAEVVTKAAGAIARFLAGSQAGGGQP